MSGWGSCTAFNWKRSKRTPAANHSNGLRDQLTSVHEPLFAIVAMTIHATASQDTAGIVRACFTAYERKDRALIELLLAPDFTFSSPLDDCISRERYFERCWPNSEHAGI